MTDRDFANFRAGPAGGVASAMMLQDSIPIVKYPTTLIATTVTLPSLTKRKPVGMSRPSFSNGAAYADLDNDGDLDVWLNNINDSAFVYENRLYERKKEETNHYLRVKLIGSPRNQGGVGAKVMVRYGDGLTQ